MTNKHTAVHNDVIFTRNSAGRVYTHCVIAIASDIAGAEAYIAAHQDRIEVLRTAYEAASKTWKEDPSVIEAAATSHPYSSPEYKANQEIKYGGLYKLHQKASDAYWGGSRTYRSAETVVAAGKDGLLYEDGWAGRPDLADKKVSKGCPNPFGRMLALEATMVESKKRAKKAAA